MIVVPMTYDPASTIPENCCDGEGMKRPSEFCDSFRARIDRMMKAKGADGIELHAEVISERHETYGDYNVNWDATALHFTGIIRQWLGRTDIPTMPAAVAALFPVAMKLSRLAKTPNHEDSIVDIQAYLTIAKDLAG